MAVNDSPHTEDTANPHTTDDILDPFLQPTFDPVDYLNATLPALTTNIPSATHTDRATISTLSTTTNTLLTTLSASTSRLSTTLTQLTDEILRNSTRLAYEVEILHGETDSLSEALLTTLASDLSLFGPDAPEPDSVTRLRTLTAVRARLDAVVKVFGDALAWPVAAGDTSLIAVGAPQQDEAGREAAAKLRTEIETLLAGEGVEAATARVEQLRVLAGVWRGTSEEKARTRVVEGLAKLVEEEQRRVAKKAEGRRGGGVSSPAQGERRTGTPVQGEGAYGFMNSLRKIRGDIYTE